MHRFAVLALAALMPSAGLAQDPTCDELWFTRNAQFHLAGYCFGSPLGQEVFGNSGCTGTDVTLSDEAQALVGRIRQVEAEMGCAVDTSVTALNFDMDQVPDRLALRHHPVVWFGESGCIGWRGEPAPLMSGHSGEGSRWGTIERGDMIVFGHEPVGPWEFVTVYEDPGAWRLKGIGWAALGDWGDDKCDMYAG